MLKNRKVTAKNILFLVVLKSLPFSQNFVYKNEHAFLSIRINKGACDMKKFKHRRLPLSKKFKSKKQSYGVFKPQSIPFFLSIKNNLPNKYLLLFLLIFIIFCYGFWKVDKAFSPTIMKYSEKETKRIASLVINDAYESASNNLEGQQIIIHDVDENGKSAIRTNTFLINKIISSTTKRVEENISKVENGDLSFISLPKSELKQLKKDDKGFYLDVPIGVATNTTLLSKVGPTIPVRFSVVGDAIANVTTDVKPFGFNNSVVDVIMDIEVNMNVIIPFSSKTTKVKVQVPIASEIIEGEVPSFLPYTSNQLAPNQSTKDKK